jgi:hypothetical protein
MTRESLWTNVAPLAALSQRWVYAGNFASSEDIFGLPYVSTFRRGRVNPFSNFPWQIRLLETNLPFLASNIRVNEMPALLPVHRWQSADIHRTVTINARQVRLWDVYQNISTPFLAQFLTVSQGREIPCQRLKGFFDASPSGRLLPATNTNYTDISDHLNGTARIIKRDLVNSLVMFVPRVDESNLWGGAYVCVRNVLPRSEFPANGVGIDYADDEFISCVFVEIGELLDGAMVPRDSILFPAQGLRIDCGVGRIDLAAQEGTAFYCNVTDQSSVSVLKFPLVVDDADSQLCGVLFGIPNGLINQVDPFQRYRSFAYPMGFAQSPYKGIGECPAFLVKDFPDHSNIIGLSHYAGAANVQPYHDVGNVGIMTELPRSPEWGTWDHSLFPFTPHLRHIISAEGSIELDAIDEARMLPSPVYSLRDFDSTVPGEPQSVEMFPLRQVQAKTGCLEGFGIARVFSGHAENSDHLLDRSPDNSMVFSGKRITQVVVRLDPYTPQDIVDAAVAINATQAPAGGQVFLTYGQYDRSQAGWKFQFNAPLNRFWSPQSTTQNPNGDGVLYNGIEIASGVVAADVHELQTIPKGDISGELYESLVLFQHARRSVPQRIGGEGVPETIRGLFQPFTHDLTPLESGPLTGEYVCDRMVVGNYQTAGNWFHYSGAGDFSLSREVVYNVFLRATSTAFQWQGFIVDTGSTFEHYAVPISEQWQLRTDHVELHAVLGVALQEAGQFNPNLSFGFGDERESLYKSNIIFDQPRGEIRNVITYTEDKQPRPAINITLHGRGVMRGTVALTVDTSDLPGDYPWSLIAAESQKLASMAGGPAGNFVNDVWQTLAFNSSTFSVYQHQFNADQTEQLLAGETVVATRWADSNVDSSEPAAWGLYKVSVRLEVEEV